MLNFDFIIITDSQTYTGNQNIPISNAYAQLSHRTKQIFTCVEATPFFYLFQKIIFHRFGIKRINIQGLGAGKLTPHHAIFMYINMNIQGDK